MAISWDGPTGSTDGECEWLVWILSGEASKWSAEVRAWAEEVALECQSEEK